MLLTCENNSNSVASIAQIANSYLLVKNSDLLITVVLLSRVKFHQVLLVGHVI